MKEKTLSPCIELCFIDIETGMCKGCYRTLEEISNWMSYTDEKKLEVLDDLENRKEQFSR